MKPSTELAKEAKGLDVLLAENLIDPKLVEAFHKTTLYRARRTAIVLGCVLLMALVAVVFAFVQETLFKEESRKKTAAEIELTLCVREAQKQQALAAESRIIAEEAYKMAEEQLHACQSKK